MGLKMLSPEMLKQYSACRILVEGTQKNCGDLEVLCVRVVRKSQ